jgi:hypothetical protein
MNTNEGNKSNEESNEENVDEQYDQDDDFSSATEEEEEDAEVEASDVAPRKRGKSGWNIYLATNTVSKSLYWWKCMSGNVFDYRYCFQK